MRGLTLQVFLCPQIQHELVEFLRDVRRRRVSSPRSQLHAVRPAPPDGGAVPRLSRSQPRRAHPLCGWETGRWVLLWGHISATLRKKKIRWKLRWMKIMIFHFRLNWWIHVCLSLESVRVCAGPAWCGNLCPAVKRKKMMRTQLTMSQLVSSLGYGCIYAFARIYNKNQMKCVALFWGIKNIQKTPNKKNQICHKKQNNQAKPLNIPISLNSFHCVYMYSHG